MDSNSEHFTLGFYPLGLCNPQGIWLSATLWSCEQEDLVQGAEVITQKEYATVVVTASLIGLYGSQCYSRILIMIVHLYVIKAY